MTVTASTFAVAQPEIDGRVYVTETHVDNAGVAHLVEYLGPVGQTDTDRTAVMTARAGVIAAQLAVDEYMDRVQIDGWSGPLVYQTGAQFAAKMRFEYGHSVRDRVCHLAFWLLNRITDGTFTDLQVQTAFGLTTLQYTTLKTNQLIPLHDHWAAVLGAVGS